MHATILFNVEILFDCFFSIVTALFAFRPSLKEKLQTLSQTEALSAVELHVMRRFSSLKRN